MRHTAIHHDGFTGDAKGDYKKILRLHHSAWLIEAVRKPVRRVPSHSWTRVPFIFASLQFLVGGELPRPRLTRRVARRSLTFVPLAAHMAPFYMLQYILCIPVRPPRPFTA
jgi:hypothetical protein